jgi:hypothetical protein
MDDALSYRGILLVNLVVSLQAVLSSRRLRLRLALLQRCLCIRQLLRRSCLVLLLGRNKVFQLPDGRLDSISQGPEHGLCLLDNQLLKKKREKSHPVSRHNKRSIVYALQ